MHAATFLMRCLKMMRPKRRRATQWVWEAHMRRRTSWAIIGALVLSIGTAGSASSQAGPGGDTISCAYPVWPGFAPVHLAQELGYFAEEGLTVNQRFDDNRGDVLAALELGEVQCDMRTVG